MNEPIVRVDIIVAINGEHVHISKEADNFTQIKTDVGDALDHFAGLAHLMTPIKQRLTLKQWLRKKWVDVMYYKGGPFSMTS